MKAFLPLLSAAAVLWQTNAHMHADGSFCGHDADVAAQQEDRISRGLPAETAPQGILNPKKHPPHPLGARALAEQQWRPLRIKIKYDDVSGLNAQQLAYFKSDVVEPAVAKIQEILQVRQRSDDTKLFLGRPCEQFIGMNGEWKCSAVDEGDVSCGSATLPSSYFGEATIYPQGQETTVPGGAGVDDADFVLAVTSLNTQQCGGSTLAYASTCLRDDIDRPTGGRYNQCPTKLTTTAEDTRKQVYVAVHEMMHALGFSSQSFALFRDPETLAPLFPKNPTSDEHDTIFTSSCGNQAKFPSSMVEFTSERGQSGCNSIEDAASLGRDKCTQRIVLPKVQTATRDWFSCSQINGAELENQDTSCGLVSSHWEQRSMYGDLMTPIATDFDIVTPMTLALFESSGWYKGSYDAVEVNPGREWGHQAGCDIHTKRGVYPADPVSPFSDLQVVRTKSVLRNDDPFFCLSSSSTNFCTMDLRAAGQCQAVNYGSNLDDQFRYFSDARKGGINQQLDFLPNIAHNFMCNVVNGGSPNRANTWQAIGAYFGPDHDSACFATSLQHEDTFYRSASACYHYECNRENPQNPVLRIQVKNSDGTAAQGVVDCAKGEGGSTKSVSGMTGTIQCVEPEVLCGAAGSLPSPSPSNSPAPSPSNIPIPSASSSPAVQPSNTPAAAGGDGGSGGKGGDAPTPSAQSTPQATPSTTPAPVAVDTQELTEEYCPGTADAHTSGDYPAVAGARVTLDGTAGDVTCDAAPDLQAACARVLNLDSARVAVKVPEASGRRLQGSSQEVTVAVAAVSVEEAGSLETALVSSVSSGALVTELAVENQAVFGGATASVPATGGTFSGSLPVVEQEDTSGDGDDDGPSSAVIAIAMLASVIGVLVIAAGAWTFMRRQKDGSQRQAATGKQEDSAQQTDKASKAAAANGASSSTATAV